MRLFPPSFSPRDFESFAIGFLLRQEPGLNVSRAEFIRWVHKVFYDQLPDELRRVNDEKSGAALDVMGGELRREEVQVGRHIAPLASALPLFHAKRRGAPRVPDPCRRISVPRPVPHAALI